MRASLLLLFQAQLPLGGLRKNDEILSINSIEVGEDREEFTKT